GPAGVPEVAAARGGAGVSDSSGTDRVPVAGAALSPRRAGRNAGGRATADGRIDAARVPGVWLDRAAGTAPPGRASDATDGTTTTASPPVGIPHAGATARYGLATTPSGLTQRPMESLPCIGSKGAENGPSAGVWEPPRTAQRLPGRDD